MEDQEKHYITADIYLVSFLLAVGFKYVDIREGRQTKFCFADNTELQERIRRYYNNQDEVRANELFRCLRDCKRIVFNIGR